MFGFDGLGIGTTLGRVGYIGGWMIYPRQFGSSMVD
jgi:hypothetical protein